jgi:serine/threonine-protein kinase HipA
MVRSSSKKIYVYADWIGLKGPVLMGELLAAPVRGKEVFSFFYDQQWLKFKNDIVLDPLLKLYSGPQYSES